MSNTPNRADDCQKILDNGNLVVLFRNDMGSYTAAVILKPDVNKSLIPEALANATERQITDDFTPSQALYRLTEKFTTGRIA